MSLPVNLALFVLAGASIWWAGTRVERLTNSFARRTGLGSAFAGLILLAVVTSLPELATTVTAVVADNTELAVSNLLGGVAFQVVVLVIADAAARGAPVTRIAPSPGLLTSGVGVILLLAIALGGLTLTDSLQLSVAISTLEIGVHPVLLLLPPAYLWIVASIRRAENDPSWQPVDVAAGADGTKSDRYDNRSIGWVRAALAGFAVIVLVGGWAAATLADRIAMQAGLESAFVGATLLAAATSLPEVSTTVAAVRHGNADLAVSNVFGSNCLDVTLLALVSLLAADALAGQPPSSAVLLAALGTALTCLYLWGLLERSDRSIAGLGMDSIAVAAVYLAGVGALYTLG